MSLEGEGRFHVFSRISLSSFVLIRVRTNVSSGHYQPFEFFLIKHRIRHGTGQLGAIADHDRGGAVHDLPATADLVALTRHWLPIDENRTCPAANTAPMRLGLGLRVRYERIAFTRYRLFLDNHVRAALNDRCGHVSAVRTADIAYTGSRFLAHCSPFPLVDLDFSAVDID